MSDLKQFVNKYTSTVSVCRVTTIAEFNRDGAYMGDLKEIYLEVLRQSLESDNASIALEAKVLMSFMKKESIRLRKKHWPKS